MHINNLLSMQDTMSNQEIANVDLSKIAALQQKRTLAFVNHFVITTVKFLNDFSKKCEYKLMHFERKLEKINATMVLLEARLSSIPEVNTPKKVTQPQESKKDVQSEDTTAAADETNETLVSNVTVETTSESPKMLPEYEKFIKMVQVGVPLDAVKLKISLEGLNPSEFDKIIKK